MKTVTPYSLHCAVVALVLQDQYCARGGGLNLKCHSAPSAVREMELDLNSVRA